MIVYFGHIERKLQQALKLERWASINGFKFSEEKTNVIHFCNKRKLYPHPTLYVDNYLISFVPEIKFLE